MIDQPPVDIQQVIEQTFSFSTSIFAPMQYCIDPVKGIVSVFHSHSPIVAGIIKIRPNKNVKYTDLPCSEEDRSRIVEIFSTMGKHGKISLLLNHKSRLEQLGDEIRHVAPLKVLEVLCTTPNMREYLLLVMDDYFKRSNFLEGITPNLNSDATKGKLQEFLPDFATAVGTQKENLEPFVVKKAWREFIEYLFEHCAI